MRSLRVGGITLKFNWGGLMAERRLAGRRQRLRVAAAKRRTYIISLTAGQRADILFRLYRTSNINGTLGRLEHHLTRLLGGSFILVE